MTHAEIIAAVLAACDAHFGEFDAFGSDNAEDVAQWTLRAIYAQERHAPRERDQFPEMDILRAVSWRDDPDAAAELFEQLVLQDSPAPRRLSVDHYLGFFIEAAMMMYFDSIPEEDQHVPALQVQERESQAVVASIVADVVNDLRAGLGHPPSPNVLDAIEFHRKNVDHSVMLANRLLC